MNSARQLFKPILFFFLTLLVLPAGFCFAQSSDTPIKFGAALILTSDQAVYGKAMREGIEIALDEVNAGGGISGRPIKVIYEDTALNPKTAHTAATKLVSADKVIAALDSSFIDVMANGPVFEKARIPVITLWDSSEEIENLIVTSDIIADEHIRIAPEVFEDIYQTQAKDPNSSAYKKLASAYRKKFGAEPKLPLFVAWGYDGLKLLASATAHVGADPEKIKSYLYTVKDFPGVSSPISFNSKGSSPLLVSMFQLRKGRFELVE